MTQPTSNILKRWPLKELRSLQPFSLLNLFRCFMELELNHFIFTLYLLILDLLPSCPTLFYAICMNSHLTVDSRLLLLSHSQIHLFRLLLEKTLLWSLKLAFVLAKVKNPDVAGFTLEFSLLLLQTSCCAALFQYAMMTSLNSES